jgi:CRP-like cAMP-binding protein
MRYRCCRSINFLKPGEYFGEFSCLLGEARNGERCNAADCLPAAFLMACPCRHSSATAYLTCSKHLMCMCIVGTSHSFSKLRVLILSTTATPALAAAAAAAATVVASTYCELYSLSHADLEEVLHPLTLCCCCCCSHCGGQHLLRAVQPVTC